MKLWNIPVWAWVAGVAIGCVIGLLLFDGVIVALIFGVSIGTVFAIAFSTGSGSRAKDKPPADE
ncbi:hypothetical protein [Actinoplanes sp. M2I2]|uniref:hypothetical protein n=1 Tax=Actinoplanes sp. M2I2 TaxID=1734444 RepID=UPI002020CFDA|nr:hypothetical protein [Actinoplanes sp. M2I2]